MMSSCHPNGKNGVEPPSRPLLPTLDVQLRYEDKPLRARLCLGAQHPPLGYERILTYSYATSTVTSDSLPG